MTSAAFPSEVDDSRISISTYGQLDNELYARTEIWVPDDNGVRLGGRPGLWRKAARVGSIPDGASQLSANAYESLVAARDAEHQAFLEATFAAEQEKLRAARDHLMRLGLPRDVAASLIPALPDPTDEGMSL